MSVLTDIIKRTRADLKERSSRLPLRELQRKIADAPTARSFKKALTDLPFGIIGEIKQRSPSGGEMNPLSVKKAPSQYRDSRAICAVSVLTDEPFFGGSLELLQSVKTRTGKPILRKDFIVDEYQVLEARAFGADAILLMAAAHVEQPKRLAELYHLAHEVGLQCLIEIGQMSQTTPEEQRDMVPPEAEIWGINSRKFDGGTFALKHHVGRVYSGVRNIGPDTSTSADRHVTLRNLIPVGKIAVAESGIHSPTDLQPLIRLNYRAALIGTAFLKAGNIATVVKDFTKALLMPDSDEWKAAHRGVAFG